MNDAHIYCTPEQVKDEFKSVMGMYREAYAVLGLTRFSVRLSRWDPEDPKGEGEVHRRSGRVGALRDDPRRGARGSSAGSTRRAAGEAAFYGPKIDIQFPTVTGREETVSTIQLDFAQPKRLGLTYVGADGQEHTPYCIHRAPFSTHERMVAFLIEHYGGAFPTWLAPVQVQVVTVSDQYEGLRPRDRGSPSARHGACRNGAPERNRGKKIREGTTRKIPCLLIVGERRAGGRHGDAQAVRPERAAHVVG